MVRKQLLKSRLDPFCVGTIFFYGFLYDNVPGLPILKFLFFPPSSSLFFYSYFTTFSPNSIFFRKRLCKFSSRFFFPFILHLKSSLFYSQRGSKKIISQKTSLFIFLQLAIKIKFNVDRHDFK